MNFIPLSGENFHLLVTVEKNIVTKYRVLIDGTFWVESINPKPCFYKLRGRYDKVSFVEKLAGYIYFLCFCKLLVFNIFYYITFSL